MLYIEYEVSVVSMNIVAGLSTEPLLKTGSIEVKMAESAGVSKAAS